jgi:hypothetical protein
MSQAAVPDLFDVISDKLVALADDADHNVDTRPAKDDWYRPTRQGTHPQPALAWIGPVAFARAYGAVPGIDHDFGTSWGPNGDQRVSLRAEVGADAGLLAVYDPTWDEYAVLGSDVPLILVEDAFGRAQRLGEQVAVEEFVALLPKLSAVRPFPVPEL